MRVDKEDISYRNDGKEYNRKVYACKDDDTWGVIEIPREKKLA